MRTTRTLLLSLAGLALAANLAPAQRAGPRVRPIGPIVLPDRVLLEQKIKGRGQTVQLAKRDAVKQAQAILEDFLRKQQPPLSWSPSPGYIEKHLLTGEPVRCEEEDEEIRAGGNVFTVRCWSWPLVVTTDQLRQMAEVERAQRAREQRAERVARSAERMAGLGKVLAGLVVVLVVVVGYLRLDDWTKGYYTGWLQAGLVGVLLATGVGLWLWS
ncbi:MAG: hypothetical protein L0Z62_16055 [Gemmataceae bacterium]|nr:hypothetical protein [Gemmataceae bacterium]